MKKSTIMSDSRFKQIINAFADVAPILVVGDVGVDKYSLGEVTRISPEAPVPVLEVKKQWSKLGLAANVVDNLKELEVACTLGSVIGEDVNANFFENLLEERHLKTWGLVHAPERLTTFKERIVTNTQQICRVDYETNKPIGLDSVAKLIGRVKDFIESHSSLIIEDYSKGVCTQDLTSKLISQFKEAGKFVAVDPGKKTPCQFYRGADLLKPNRIEALAMALSLGYGEEDISKIGELLADKLDIRMVVITLGADGMSLYDRETGLTEVIPTAASEVFDVSGAGDTAIAAITAAMVAGATLTEAGWIGNAASGVVVGKKGTALVSRKELEHFWQRLKNRE